ncbi:thioredoxin family protein [Mariniblastus sp.]|nr:thioredoxin family protein [Mariniblastus sp.]
MEPWLHQTAEEFAGKVKFVSVDFDKSEEVIEEYEIKGPPTLVLMRGDEEIDRVLGGNKPKIRSMIEKAL